MRQMKKSQKKNREKFNELKFLRQNHGLRQRVATQAIFGARWRRDNFKKIASPSQAKNRSCSRGLRTFALIVSAHPYCARNSLPRHALSARAVEEMWRYIGPVGTLVSMHGFNSLKCSVTPYFILIDHFLCQLSTFWERLKKICIVEVWFFFNFSALASSNYAIIVAARCSQKSILEDEFN